MWRRRPEPRARKGAALGILLVALSAGPLSGSEDPLRLKPGARGKLCLGCHSDFEGRLALPSVHTPVRRGDCTGCHSPHASSHGKLLAAGPERVCLTCHGGIVPDNAASVHEIVGRGACVPCHDPHGSNFKGNLLKPGNELCLSCHEAVGRAAASSVFKHPPAEKNCLSCHDPHASAESSSLLSRREPELCLSCHKSPSAGFAAAHAGYPVSRGRCTSCHDPHGSSERGLLWEGSHPPVANRLCAQCHVPPNSPEPLATKRAGTDLCRSCHGEVVKAALSARRVHWALLGQEGCLGCHAAHGSREKHLLGKPMKILCGGCHADVPRRAERSKTKHPPVVEGRCTACHDPHAGQGVFLLVRPTLEEVCATCHDWKKHSSHPTGDQVVDPRNSNLRVDCASCHRAHGTPHEHLAHLDSKAALCLDCHEEFKR